MYKILFFSFNYRGNMVFWLWNRYRNFKLDVVASDQCDVAGWQDRLHPQSWPSRTGRKVHYYMKYSLLYFACQWAQQLIGTRRCRCLVLWFCKRNHPEQLMCLVDHPPFQEWVSRFRWFHRTTRRSGTIRAHLGARDATTPDWRRKEAVPFGTMRNRFVDQ